MDEINILRAEKRELQNQLDYFTDRNFDGYYNDTIEVKKLKIHQKDNQILKLQKQPV